MTKAFKRIISIVICLAGLIMMIFGFAGCTYQPKKVEGDVWTYYVLKSGKIALMGLNPNAVPNDEILYIPNKVDGREVAGFGIMSGKSFISSFADSWQIPYMQKLIVAEGIPIDYFFWSSAGRLVEFESRTTKNIWFNSVQKNIIVPDGCRDIYIAAMEAQSERLSWVYCILEKSEVVDWYVVDGLLKGYFGLEKDHYILPNGIKKIDGSSLNGDSPKTIILNDDLEEIGSYGLRFDIDEIVTQRKYIYIVAQYSMSRLFGPKNQLKLYIWIKLKKANTKGEQCYVTQGDGVKCYSNTGGRSKVLFNISKYYILSIAQHFTPSPCVASAKFIPFSFLDYL